MDTDLLAIQEVRELIGRSKKAQRQIADYSQDRTDKIVAKLCETAYEYSEHLARIAVEDTKMGRIESKTLKNQFCSKDLYIAVKDMKTVGVINEDTSKGIFEIAEPVGVICGIIPCTNPTSTVIYKSVIAIKSRNSIIFSPHPRAVKCISATADLLRKALESINEPSDVILSMSYGILEATSELMKHKDVNVILATGGTGLVRAAYSSGKPAYGVGPGNVPVYIETTANIQETVGHIVSSQTFDYGTVCASEQAVVVDYNIRNQVVEEFKKQNAYFTSPQETTLLEKVVIKGDIMNPEVVGQSAFKIAQMAGFSVPTNTTILISEQTEVGPQAPLSREKLCPVLSFYTCKSFDDCLQICLSIVNFGGLGHTACIHSNDQQKIKIFAEKLPVYRLLINTSTTQGGVGLSTNLFPSMTLGCGTIGGNITADNISPLHLINVKRVALDKSVVIKFQQFTSPEKAIKSWEQNPFEQFPKPVFAGKQESITPYTLQSALTVQQSSGFQNPLSSIVAVPEKEFISIGVQRDWKCPISTCSEFSRSRCHSCG